MLSTWEKSKEKAEAENRPILVLAPMADVTDAAFRSVIAKYGKPDVLWTEFVSADGLAFAREEGRKKLLKDLIFSENEHPIVAQFFTSNPESMKKAAALAVEMGFDGIDINMGCPDRSIEKQGAGAAMMKNPKRAREIIRAAKEGACSHGPEKEIPVSVKTRLGYSKDELENWLPEVLAEEPVVVTVHARTRKEMSLVPARWDRVARAVGIRNELKSRTLIFGNGDVLDIDDAIQKGKETGADGIMLGRAIFGNPWLFSNRKNISIEEKLNVLTEHANLFQKLLGDTKSFAIMKKHFKAYVNGWDSAKDLRLKLMETKNAEEVSAIISDYLKNGLK
jgi:nifR3 family TIM-barrel protein